MDIAALPAALVSADDYLHQGIRIMEDVDNIGVWIRSDDSSDNRKRRKLLMEASWAVASASRALLKLQTEEHVEIDRLEDDLNKLSDRLEQLANSVPDTMQDRDPQFTLTVGMEQVRAQEIQGRVRQLAVTFRERVGIAGTDS